MQAPPRSQAGGRNQATLIIGSNGSQSHAWTGKKIFKIRSESVKASNYVSYKNRTPSVTQPSLGHPKKSQYQLINRVLENQIDQTLQDTRQNPHSLLVDSNYV